MRRVGAGVTLVELLVTLAILSVLMVAVTGVILHQTRMYQLGAQGRDAVAASRTSFALLERHLRNAGWGVDPRHAFDFGTAAEPLARDSMEGPDELVFFSRDPGFHRVATRADAAGLTFDTPLAQPMEPGQVLLVICPHGIGAAYVTVSGMSGPDSVSLFSAAGAFPREPLPDCSAGPYVVKVDRYRFFVADVDEGDGAVRPYLLLDQGLERVRGSRGAYDTASHRFPELRDATPGDGAGALPAGALRNLIPLAANVEDFQVAYLMNRPEASWGLSPQPQPPDDDGSWTFGDADDGQPDAAARAPGYEHSYRDALRFTGHPANIRGVRISLVTRSSREVQRHGRRPARENHAAAEAEDDYYRTLLTTQVLVRNLQSRSEFAPLQVQRGGGPDVPQP